MHSKSLLGFPVPPVLRDCRSSNLYLQASQAGEFPLNPLSSKQLSLIESLPCSLTNHGSFKAGQGPLEAHFVRKLPPTRAPSAVSLDLRLNSLQSEADSDGGLEHAAVETDQPVPSGQDSSGGLAIARGGELAGENTCPNAGRVEQGRGLSPLSHNLLRRGSSASSNEELIGALHSTPQPSTPPPCSSLPSPRRSAKSPLPAPPTHLKVPYPISSSLNGHLIICSSQAAESAQEDQSPSPGFTRK